MKLRAIIADDEPLARERVRDFLAGERDVEIVGECPDGLQTLAAVREHQPDLLFLDVQMPGLDGFEVIEALEPELPAVIFTTAYDEHAIRAFEVNALDYLLKPFTEARFRMAMERARAEIREGKDYGQGRWEDFLEHLRAGRREGRILVRSPDRILFLKPEEIDWVESAGNYVVLHAGKDRHILRETTASMESRLEPAGFMRINRSAIVNLARVREVQPIAPGQYSVLLTTGTRLDMTCSLNELQHRLARV